LNQPGSSRFVFLLRFVLLSLTAANSSLLSRFNAGREIVNLASVCFAQFFTPLSRDIHRSFAFLVKALSSKIRMDSDPLGSTFVLLGCSMQALRN
jgi:hypothetical protein